MENECSICKEELTKNIRETLCQHRFHDKCLRQWEETKHNSCPLCRRNLYPFRDIVEPIPIGRRIVVIEPFFFSQNTHNHIFNNHHTFQNFL